MLNMIWLARLTGRVDLEERANRVAREFAHNIEKNPINHMQMLIALNTALFPPPEIVIVGRSDDAGTQELISLINHSAILDTLVVNKPVDQESDITRLAPFTSDLQPLNNRATAYLCRDYQCAMPTNDKEELVRKLEVDGNTHRD
jgi:hypothetical protein